MTQKQRFISDYASQDHSNAFYVVAVYSRTPRKLGYTVAITPSTPYGG
jgi:hypothetical protein